jgi:hypothetical protein
MASRPVGRSKIGWKDNVMKDIEAMRIVKWKRCARDRNTFFCNPILFAICTSTFGKLCKNIYTVACRTNRFKASCGFWE